MDFDKFMDDFFKDNGGKSEEDIAIDALMNHVLKIYNKALSGGLTQEQAFEMAKMVLQSILF